MQQNTDRVFKDLLSRLQKEVLKAKGFKKSGGNFHVILPDGTSKIISFQKSMFNSYGECRFTVNIGYGDPEIQVIGIQYKCPFCQMAAF